jgi:predicted Rossmann-fold nucleotide-binding protein
MKISKLKEKSGAKLFASILGKSTISKDSEEYETISRFTEILLKNGYGVIHGGYAGGAMSATSDSANLYIEKYKLSQFLNIAVPQKQHDGLWERVIDAQFTDTAEDIFQRLKIVTSGDIAVICPLGGDGTELEETIIFHENVVSDGMNKYGKHKGKVTPLIFFQTKKGTDWKNLIETKIKTVSV